MVSEETFDFARRASRRKTTQAMEIVSQ